MSHSHDLTQFLKDWPYDPTGVTARYVRTAEGVEMVQFRTDLGLMQMYVTGRPDGTRPFGHNSALEYYRRRWLTERHKGFRLTEEACNDLQLESVQYYYRYTALYALKAYDQVIVDTQHNLDIFDLVWEFGQEFDIWEDFIQFKPCVWMMNTRARAEKLTLMGKLDEAHQVIDRGMNLISTFIDDMYATDPADLENNPELVGLRELRESIERGTPPPANPLRRLRERLQHAIRQEDFEEAARLRDELQASETPSP